MNPKPPVLVTRRLPQPVMELLAESFDLALNPHEGPMPRRELLAAARGQSGLLTLLVDQVDAELLDAAGGSLRAVANYAVGYNNIDVAAASRRGVAVCNTPEVLTDSTADLALMKPSTCEPCFWKSAARPMIA